MFDEVKAKFDGKGKKNDDLYSQEYDQTTGKYSFRPEWEEFLIYLVNFEKPTYRLALTWFSDFDSLLSQESESESVLL